MSDVSPELTRMAERCRLGVSIYWEPVNGYVIADKSRDVVFACRLYPAEATAAYVALRDQLEAGL